MSKYELFRENDSLQNETFEEFVSRNMNSDTSRCGENKFTPEALKGLVNEEFDNILYCQGSKGNTKGAKGIKGYETEIKYNDTKYYEFTTKPIPKKIDIRFGCELETCFILNCRKEVREEVEEIAGGKVENFDSMKKWQNLIYYHLRNNIIPYLNPEFIEKFRFANIYTMAKENTGLILDMKNGNIVNENLESQRYRTLIFEPDSSIRCDKTQSKDDMGNFYDSIPIPCEIVTPILSSIDDLRILYEGLLPKHNDFPCNQSNSYMGFHVNVSAVDEKGKIVELTRGMITELIYDWLHYEKKNYKSLRGEGTFYAKKIQDYINNDRFIKILYENIINKNNEKIKISEIYEPYGIASWYINKIINKEKYLSMTHHKQNNVIEFRVFNSSTNIEKLISYTQDAIDLFKNTIQKYCDNPEETLIQIQKQNLKYKYLHVELPIRKFNHRLTDFIEYLNLDPNSKIDSYYYIKKGFLGFGTPKKSFAYFNRIDNLLEEGKIENFYMVVKHYNSYFIYNLRKSANPIINVQEISEYDYYNL